MSRNVKMPTATLCRSHESLCAFCNRRNDDEVAYGQMYIIGDISCHYYCVLLSCCLVQKGNDEEGLLGFLYADILAEVERGKKHKCSYCFKPGATMGCCISSCRKQFHMPCGQEKGVIGQFYGNYKSFCIKHAPKQDIPKQILEQANYRKIKKQGSALHAEKPNDETSISSRTCSNATFGNFSKVQNKSVQQRRFELLTESISESECAICYEEVDAFPSPSTFWPPCCARDCWLHRRCLQRMALSAGMYYLKCPLCNDKETFGKAVAEQGIYIPDCDAAWELEQNAFRDLYQRVKSCSMQECLCPQGRDYDADTGEWEVNVCVTCGGCGVHAGCDGGAARYVCVDCRAVPLPDLDALEDVPLFGAEQQGAPLGAGRVVRPLMPSRMSIRRTKPIRDPIPSTSRIKMVSVSPSKCDQFPFTIKLYGAETESGETSRTGVLYHDSFELVQGALNAKGYPVNAAVSRGQIKADDIVKLIKPGPVSVKKKQICKALRVLLPDNEMNNLSCNNENSSISDIESPINHGSFTHSTPSRTHKRNYPPLLDMTNTSTPYKTKVASHTLNFESVSKMFNNPSLNEMDSSFELPKEFIADKDSDISLDANEITVPVTNVENTKRKLFENGNQLISTPPRVILNEVEFEEKYLNEIEPNSKKYCLDNNKSNESDFKFEYLKETSNEFTPVSSTKNLNSDHKVILNFDSNMANDFDCNELIENEKKVRREKRKHKERKRKKNKGIKKDEIKMKIKWKHKEFQFKICGVGGKDGKKSRKHTRMSSHPDKKKKVKNIKQSSKHFNKSKDTGKKTFKQPILTFSLNDSTIQYLEKEEIPKKKSKVHRSPTTNDGLKQTSISSFLIKK